MKILFRALVCMLSVTMTLPLYCHRAGFAAEESSLLQAESEASHTVIIDNETLGSWQTLTTANGPEYFEQGGWKLSGAAMYVVVGQNSRYFDIADQAPGQAVWAKWQPLEGKLIPGKHYRVWFANNSIINDPYVGADATLEIYHNGQRETMPRTPVTTAQWVELGTYLFDGSGSEYVRLIAGKTSMRADAVKFELVPSTPTAIEIDGDTTTMLIPETGSYKKQFAATVLDQFGESVSGLNVLWKVDDSASGVSVDSNGNVSVTGEAAPGAVTITAEVEGFSQIPPATKTINLVREVLSDITIVGGDQMAIPVSGTSTRTYTISARNQLDEEMTGMPAVSWSLASAVAGVSVNSQTGLVTVESTASAGSTFSLTCTYSSDASIHDTLTVTLVPEQMSSIEVTGAEVVTTPFSGEKLVAYTAQVKNQFGDVMHNKAIRWQAEGLDINENGIVMLTAESTPGSYKIIAELVEDDSYTAEINVVVEKAVLTSVAISGERNFVVLPDKAVTAVFDAKVLDQYGEELPNEAVQWQLSEKIKGISLSDTGKLTIAEKAEAGEFVITAKAARNNQIGTSINVSVVRQPATARIGKLTANKTSVKIPYDNSIATVSFTATVVDQYGMAMASEKVLWSMNGAVSGVTLSENGILSITSSAEKGTVTVRATPESNSKGYQEISVSLSEATRSNTYSGGGGGSGSGVPSQPLVTSPGNQEQVGKNGPAAFSDLAGYGWAEPAIQGLAEKGIINGVSDKLFAPEQNVTRGEVAKMLVLALGLKEKIPTATTFSDISTDDWYYGYVYAAKDAGIIFGYSDGRFGANDNITRQDMAVMVHRAITLKGVKAIAKIEAAAFTDEQEIADYAMDAVGALRQLGVLSGYEDGSFAPLEHTNRAQVAKVIFAAIFPL